MWQPYLCETMTGLIKSPIDIPSFSWEMSVGDSALATTKDKGTGEGEASSITVPWTAVPASDAAGRSSALSSVRRGIVLMWHEEEDGDGLGRPIIYGAIGQRKDTALDTSFDLLSPLTLLGNRVAVPEGVFGTGGNGQTRGQISYKNLSLRAIVSDLGRISTAKPGGCLPIDWSYSGERGPRERTYYNYNVGNNSCKKLFEDISNVENGPDIQLRPYLYDSQHVRLRLLAGSESEPYLGQSSLRRLTWPGTINDLTVDHLGPVSRVYATGAGSEDEQMGYLASDTSLQSMSDPYPLVEEVVSFSDDDNFSVLKSHANARLAVDKYPVMQITATINVTGKQIIGSLWPGEVVELAIDGFPTLPDGVYNQRVMSMRGDESDNVTIIFDVTRDPIY